MRRKSILFIYMLSLGALFFSCKTTKTEESFSNPQIQMGNVKISGKITYETKKQSKGPIIMTFDIPHPITGERITKEIKTDSSGYYCVEFETETNPTICMLSTNVNSYKTVLLELSQNKELNLDLSYSRREIKSINYDKNSLTENDMLFSMELLDQAIDYRSKRERPQLYNKPPEAFLQYADEVINDRLQLIDKNNLVSENSKKYLNNTLRLYFTLWHILNYVEEMKFNYMNINSTRNTDSLSITPPSRGYYKFMKNLNLNSGLQFCNLAFIDIQEQILLNDTLNIPPIEDTTIKEWQKTVKKCIANLIGFNEGQYYDVLTANAYALQLKKRVQPLSEKQKENIHIYFKGGEIEKILLSQNEKTLKRISSMEPLSINNSDNIDANQLIEDIIAKNKGKAIIIDLWATWCGPCIMALNQIKTLDLPKEELAHVYITNTSSPKKIWNNKITEIGGQHYYLNDATWEMLLDKYSFTKIPSYLIFDKKGNLKHHFTGYPGNIEMIEIIKDALK